jgi:hypothetical protein
VFRDAGADPQAGAGWQGRGVDDDDSTIEPGPGQVRLHFAGNKQSKTWKSRQEGLHLLAQGAFAGIRNIATHTSDEWSEQVALEHLAVLSVVARWTDETRRTSPAAECPASRSQRAF